MNKIKKIFNIEVIIFLIINILWSLFFNIFVLTFLLFILVALDPKTLILNWIIRLFLVFYTFIWWFGLPIYYFLLDKFSHNRMIKEFIYKLKKEYKFKLKFLLQVESILIIVFGILGISATFSHGINSTNLFKDLIIYTLGIIYISLFCWNTGAYLFMFLWWEVVKLIKKLHKKLCYNNSCKNE